MFVALPPQDGVIRSSVREALRSVQCTLTATGSDAGQAQPLLACLSCRVPRVCLSCASVCHRGHALTDSGATAGTCGCASGAPCELVSATMLTRMLPDVAAWLHVPSDSLPPSLLQRAIKSGAIATPGPQWTPALQDRFCAAALQLLLLAPPPASGDPAAALLPALCDLDGFVTLPSLLTLLRDHVYARPPPPPDASAAGRSAPPLQRGVGPQPWRAGAAAPGTLSAVVLPSAASGDAAASVALPVAPPPLLRLLRALHACPSLRPAKLGSSRARLAPRHPAAAAVVSLAVCASRGCPCAWDGWRVGGRALIGAPAPASIAGGARALSLGAASLPLGSLALDAVLDPLVLAALLAERAPPAPPAAAAAAPAPAPAAVPSLRSRCLHVAQLLLASQVPSVSALAAPPLDPPLPAATHPTLPYPSLDPSTRAAAPGADAAASLLASAPLSPALDAAVSLAAPESSADAFDFDFEGLPRESAEEEEEGEDYAGGGGGGSAGAPAAKRRRANVSSAAPFAASAAPHESAAAACAAADRAAAAARAPLHEEIATPEHLLSWCYARFLELAAAPGSGGALAVHVSAGADGEEGEAGAGAESAPLAAAGEAVDGGAQAAGPRASAAASSAPAREQAPLHILLCAGARSADIDAEAVAAAFAGDGSRAYMPSALAAAGYEFATVAAAAAPAAARGRADAACARTASALGAERPRQLPLLPLPPWAVRLCAASASLSDANLAAAEALAPLSLLFRTRGIVKILFDARRATAILAARWGLCIVNAWEVFAALDELAIAAAGPTLRAAIERSPAALASGGGGGGSGAPPFGTPLSAARCREMAAPPRQPLHAASLLCVWALASAAREAEMAGGRPAASAAAAASSFAAAASPRRLGESAAWLRAAASLPRCIALLAADFPALLASNAAAPPDAPRAPAAALAPAAAARGLWLLGCATAAALADASAQTRLCGGAPLALNPSPCPTPLPSPPPHPSSSHADDAAIVAALAALLSTGEALRLRDGDGGGERGGSGPRAPSPPPDPPSLRLALQWAALRSQLACLRAPPHDPHRGGTLQLPLAGAPWYLRCRECGAQGQHFVDECPTRF